MHVMQDETMSVQQPRGVGQKERLKQELSAQMGDHLTVFGRVLLLVSLLMGAISHGYHLFLYPLYITDEGIYMQQAWSILREGTLSPYTYSYDHAPAGWLVIAGWVSILPRQFHGSCPDAAGTLGKCLLALPGYTSPLGRSHRSSGGLLPLQSLTTGRLLPAPGAPG